MPRKCVVPACKSNYKGSEYVTVFFFPKDDALKRKWVEAIHREDFSPSAESVVCIKHFDDQFIINEDKVRRDDGTWLCVKRSKPKLTPAAYPTKFPNQPSYLSVSLPCKRKSPDERLQEQVDQDEENLKAFLCEDTISSFDAFKRLFREKLPCDWFGSFSEQYAVFFKCNFTENPEIISSVKVSPDLTVLGIWYKNIKTKPSKLSWLLGTSNKCDLWSKFDCIISHLNSWNDTDVKKETVSFASQILLDSLLEYNERSTEYVKLKFLQEQLTLVNSKQPRYSPTILTWACSVFYSYPTAYRFIRDTLVLTLPHPVYLKRLAEGLVGSSGLECPQIKYLKEKSQLLKSDEKIVNILVDEIYVKPKLSFKNGNIEGSACNTEETEEATTIVCFMIASLFSTNKDVVAMFPAKNLNATQLYDLTLKVLDILHQTGYNALTVISDNNRVNRNMFQKLCGGTLKTFVTNPFSKAKLFLIFDTVHLFKSVRNNWLNQTDFEQTFVFPSIKTISAFEEVSELPNVCRASVIHLKQLYDCEKHKSVKLAPHLSKKVLCPTKLERQNVLFAVRLFDEKNIAALNILGTGLETKHFLEIISTFWKIVNVKHPLKGKHLRDSFSDPIRNINDVGMQFLQTMKSWLQEWDTYHIVETTRHGKLTLETQTALLHTVDALYQLGEYMLTELKVHYILFGKFQNDNLEGRFGQYRQMCGGNYNVSVREVLESERKLKIISLIKINSSENGEFSLKNFIHNVQYNDSLISDSDYEYFQNITYEQYYVNFDANDIRVIIYISGYVARQVNCCIDCKEKLSSNRAMSFEFSGSVIKYLEILDRGGLNYPTRLTVHYCMSTIRVFNVMLSEFYENKFRSLSCQRDLIMRLTLEFLSSFEKGEDIKCLCGKSGFDLRKQCIKVMSNILLNNYCKTKNNNLDEVKETKAKTRKCNKRKLSTLKK